MAPDTHVQVCADELCGIVPRGEIGDLIGAGIFDCEIDATFGGTYNERESTSSQPSGFIVKRLTSLVEHCGQGKIGSDGFRATCRR